MKAHLVSAPLAFVGEKIGHWPLWGGGLLAFLMGGLVTGIMLTPAHARAEDGQRVFELMVYHAVPGKGPDLEAIFRDCYKFQTKHGLNVVGYWVPNEDPAWKDTFIYLVAHPSREQAEKNWDALHQDPEFRPYIESAKPLIQKQERRFLVDEVYMRPTDFSAMR